MIEKYYFYCRLLLGQFRFLFSTSIMFAKNPLWPGKCLHLGCWLAVLCWLTAAQVHAQKNSQQDTEAPSVVVVLDAGHGGHDPGKLRSNAKYSHEKDIALDIALQVGELLEEKLEGVGVVYTRKTDVFVPLEERANIANSAGANYFISIHCNSSPKKKIFGVQLHIQDHTFNRSRKLATAIEKELVNKAGRNTFGLFNYKDRRFHLYVLQYTTMPGVLIETGFLSNATEEKFLNSDEGKQQVANSIFSGIKKFLLAMNHDVRTRKTSNKNKTVADKEKEEKDIPIYKVQIAASDKPLPENHPKFEQLGMDVEEHFSKKDAKYRYTVGGGTFEAAKKLAEEVRKSGFKDAFVVEMED
jgi:N-acetylmuramoyl-L-alanine amidase